MSGADTYQSWARLPHGKPQDVVRPAWIDEGLPPGGGQLLAYGLGRSYSDCCLNEGGTLVDTRLLNRFLEFDRQQGVLRCEAGVPLAEILQMIVPAGWWLPVTPGTQYVTVGGAVANDVHGKNHYRAGTFGAHVRRLLLVRSDGQQMVCSPTENADMFAATVGGLGLTGLIAWVELELVQMPSRFMDVDAVAFGSLSEYAELLFESEESFDYMVAWIDGIGGGRGILQRAHFSAKADGETVDERPTVRVPIDAPAQLLNRYTIGAYNWWRYHRHEDGVTRQYYRDYFYELDSIRDWNRLYGKRGFYQYQFAVPRRQCASAMAAIWKELERSRVPTYLVTSRLFGDKSSPGMLSFPRPGVTFALDFPNRGVATLALLAKLDEIVRGSGGWLYPAKDGRMPAAMFQYSYPRWQEFAEYIDERFSSDFWRRVSVEI